MGAPNIFRLFRTGHSTTYFVDAKGALAFIVTAAFDFHIIILWLRPCRGACWRQVIFRMKELLHCWLHDCNIRSNPLR